MGAQQELPKKLRLLVDVSGSMYRFNSYDGRLEREMETCIMAMEALEGYEDKIKVLYFFCYKTEFYSFLNSPKNLDPSQKKHLDLWDCLGRVLLVFYQNFIGLIESFVVILERGKPCLIAE